MGTKSLHWVFIHFFQSSLIAPAAFGAKRCRSLERMAPVKLEAHGEISAGGDHLIELWARYLRESHDAIPFDAFRAKYMKGVYDRVAKWIRDNPKYKGKVKLEARPRFPTPSFEFWLAKGIDRRNWRRDLKAFLGGDFHGLEYVRKETRAEMEEGRRLLEALVKAGRR